ncbi:TVG0161955 [Thermoplasma volcanium GSS1]|uniref:TVG0161955 protein n=1 Tax=Thermoplasma volcanium (strain ATCC 51530 / DSM 4299 / JCM 9571 / NBRC 15438 / GSS1) TaxID=273116 RepID=Q97CE9_THEVO|nr:APC family permease [Thermoplasma volcanium]BAB59294.1 TVG0161955 [Thermoplasma volcanium GSS1]
MGSRDLGVGSSIMQSIGGSGPMLNIVGVFAIIASFSSINLVYIVIGAFIISLVNIYMPYRASKIIRSNGGYYTLNGIFMGKRTGLFVSILYLIYGFAAFPSITIFTVSILYYLSGSLTMSVVAADAIAASIAFVTMGGTYVSAKVLKILGALEIMFIVLLDVSMISHGSGVISPYALSSATTPNFWYGIMFGLLMFSGLGSSLFISENTKNSKVSVSRGIAIAYAVSGSLMVVTALAIERFLGNNISYYSSNPFYIIGSVKSVLGSYFYIFFLFFSVSSAFNLAVAYLNAFSNSAVKMGEDGIIAPLSRRKVLAISLALDIVASSVFPILFGPFVAFVTITGLVSASYLTVHLISNVSLYKHISASREVIGKIMLIASSFTVLVTLAYSILADIYTSMLVDIFFAIALLVAIYSVFYILRSSRYTSIIFHYE